VVTVYNEEGKVETDPSKDKDEDRDKSGKPRQLERNPQIAKQPARTAETKSTNPDDDPDRPHFKKGGSTPAAKGNGAVEEDDPNRPRITRNRVATQATKTDPRGGVPIPQRLLEHAPHATSDGPIYEAIAISDADLSAIPQSYRFRATED